MKSSFLIVDVIFFYANIIAYTEGLVQIFLWRLLAFYQNKAVLGIAKFFLL